MLNLDRPIEPRRRLNAPIVRPCRFGHGPVIQTHAETPPTTGTAPSKKGILDRIAAFGREKFVLFQHHRNPAYFKKMVESGNRTDLKILLDHGLNPNQKDTNGLAPLHWIALSQNPKAHLSAETLILAGADPNATDPKGKTPIRCAVDTANKNLIPVLTSLGADPNQPDNEKISPLSVACNVLENTYWQSSGVNAELVKTLLKNGANPNLPGKDGFTPLHLAAMRGFKSAMELMIAHGGDLYQYNDNGLTPLHTAISRNPDMIHTLKKMGANLDFPYRDGRPASLVLAKYLATSFDDRDDNEDVVLKALIEQGADMKARDTENGKTILHYLINSGFNNLYQLALAHGADENQTDHEGQVPLQARLNALAKMYQEDRRNEWESVINRFQQKGIPLSAPQQYFVAIKKNQPYPVNTADPETGKTLMHHLAEGDFTKLFILATEQGGDILLPDHAGTTPLQIAMTRYEQKKYGWEPILMKQVAEGKLSVEDMPVNARILLELASPGAFLRDAFLNLEEIGVQQLSEIFRKVEYSNTPEFWKPILPELLALMKPYARMAGEDKELINKASAGITRILGYLGKINKLQGIAYNNWSRIGTLGLSFSKWKYDAMQPWKGMGPMAQPTMLMQSGLFQPIPTRPGEPPSFKGFGLKVPGSNVSIELRRAFAVISKPGVGTLVVRNSSPDFQQELFPTVSETGVPVRAPFALLSEVAYFNPEKVFPGEGDWFNPMYLWPGGIFMDVLGHDLNRTTESQEKHHEKIQVLLNAFDEAMQPYTAWKCGFRNGEPPKGFGEMLNLALMSATGGGAASPFKRFTNLRLAWVNPYELPMPVVTYDLQDIKHQQEAALYLDVLHKRRQIRTPEEYKRAMPDLIAFLNHGLSQGLELTLV